MIELFTFALVGASASFLVLRDKKNVVMIPAFVTYVFLRDIYHGGFGFSNGRLLSFLDSFNSCYKFRVAIENESLKYVPTTYVRAATLKFMAGSMTSLLLYHTPTVLRGPRHILSFSLAYIIIFGTDTVFLKMRQSLLSRLFLGVANSLYKLRKLMFVLHHGSSTGFVYTLLVSLLAIEGSSSLRNLTCGRDINMKTRFSSWGIGSIISLLSSFSEAIAAVTVIYLACARVSSHGTEPSFMEPIISILYWSYSELQSTQECVVNPNDLSLSFCVCAKWIGFIIFIVRNWKSDLFSGVTLVSDKESMMESSRSSSSITSSSKQNFFMSPFKKNVRREKSE
jgi:hypothetical protein